MVQHRDVCRGEGCDCCKVCGHRSFAAADGRCLHCHPPARPEPKVRSRAARVTNKSIARAREAELYRQHREGGV